MAFVATFLLIIVLIVRPQEIWPSLTALRLLDVLTALSALGVIIEMVMGKMRRLYSPQLPFLLAFLLSAYFSSGLYLGREGLTRATEKGVIAVVFMLIVAYGARTSQKTLRVLFGLLLGLALFVGVVVIHQGRQEPSCLEADPSSTDTREDGIPDGRTCDNRAECTKGGRGDVDYECERLGWFKTVSVERRVRWRGQLGDPNELAVYFGAVIPFVFALFGAWRRTVAIPVIAVSLGILLYGVILTQSRGGQLVVGVVFGVLFGLRYRVKGLVAAGVLALPVLLLGGRGGADADASADERLDVLYDAITAFVHHPIFGQGIGAFTEDRHLTPHNAYVLTAVDLGLPGFFAWIGLLYMSLKIPITILRRPPAILDPSIPPLALATAVSFAGMAVGIFFLSFTYKQLLFVWIGMSGALYGAVRNDDHNFEVGLGWKDLLIISGASLTMLAVIFGYTRIHPP